MEHSSSTGSSMNSSTSWSSQELDWASFQSHLLAADQPRPRAASYADLVGGRCSIDEVMREFRMNGSDAPYSPEDDGFWPQRAEVAPAPGAPAYLRQRSWPAPERSPAPRLPRPLSAVYPAPAPAATPAAAATALDFVDLCGGGSALTEQAWRVVSSLPDAAVLALLREMRRRRLQPEECRFCKNNGERESYYRAHALKDARGRVQCPVLRAFTCARCGASGDSAHTIKYCPLSTADERIKSAAMMRSLRMASGRRRAPPAPAPCAPPAAARAPPLDSRWTALEQKLLLS